jgi:hypothetical protein
MDSGQSQKNRSLAGEVSIAIVSGQPQFVRRAGSKK